MRRRCALLALGAAAPRRFAPLRGLASSPGHSPGAPAPLAQTLGGSPCSRSRAFGPPQNGSGRLLRFAPLFAPLRCCRAGAPTPSLAPSGAAAPPAAVAAPVRPFRPSLRSPGPGPGRAPRLRRSAACAPLCGSAGSRCRRSRFAPPRCATGSLSGRPCSACGRATSSRRSPGPPSAVRVAALGPAGSRPGARRLSPPFSAFRPPGLVVLAGSRPLRWRFVGGFSPAAPPPLPPPLGARGEREAVSQGLRPPTPYMARAPPGVRQAVRPLIIAARARARSGGYAALALAAALFLAQGLDKGEHMRYYVGARLFPGVSAPHLGGCPRAARRTPAEMPGFFFCSEEPSKKVAQDLERLFLPACAAAFCPITPGGLTPGGVAPQRKFSG